MIDETTKYLHEAISVFARMRAPVVAGVNGTVAGAGLGLMASADLLSSDNEDLEQQMKHESASIVQMSRSHDGLAGVKAFKDKVEPNFVGS